jgi:hypothetical protein
MSYIYALVLNIQDRKIILNTLNAVGFEVLTTMGYNAI